jgi:hypothetical protein
VREIIKITKIAPTAFRDITPRIANPELSMRKQLRERLGWLGAGWVAPNSQVLYDR